MRVATAIMLLALCACNSPKPRPTADLDEDDGPFLAMVDGLPKSTADAKPILGKGRSVAPESLKMAYLGPQISREFGEIGADRCLSAVILASNAVGDESKWIFSGTLTQAPKDPKRFTYSDQPKGKMRVVYSNGVKLEFTTTAFEGDLSEGAKKFLEGDHVLKLRFVRSGVIDLQIVSTRKGGATSASVSGTFVLDGITYTCSITSKGTSRSRISDDFVTTERQSTTTGALSAEGFSLEASEGYSSKSSYNDRKERHVQNQVFTFASSWTAGESRFAFRDGRTQRSFINQKPEEVASYWRASGDLLWDDEAYGEVRGGVRGEKFAIWIQAGKEKIALEEWDLK